MPRPPTTTHDSRLLDSSPPRLLDKFGADSMLVTLTYDEQDGKTTLTSHTLFSSEAVANACPLSARA